MLCLFTIFDKWRFWINWSSSVVSHLLHICIMSIVIIDGSEMYQSLFYFLPPGVQNKLPTCWHLNHLFYKKNGSIISSILEQVQSKKTKWTTDTGYSGQNHSLHTSDTKHTHLTKQQGLHCRLTQVKYIIMSVSFPLLCCYTAAYCVWTIMFMATAFYCSLTRGINTVLF